jgi:predicted amidohydrolase YtcJ
MGSAMRTLFRDVTVWSGLRPSPAPGWLLLEDGRVSAVGTATEAPPRDEGVQVRSLPDHHVLPGLTDAHSHLSVGCWLPRTLDGSGWRSREEALTAVAEAHTRTPGQGWLLATGFDHAAWRDPRPPSQAELEVVAPGRRALLVHLSLHAGVLSAQGLDAVARPAPGFRRLGDVDRGRRGEPTGLVWEGAFGRALFTVARELAAELGEPTMAELLEAEADRHLRLGITRAHDPGVPPDGHARMQTAAGRTPLRLSWSVTGAAGLVEPPPRREPELPEGPYGETDRQVKLFLDGAQRCALTLPLGALPSMISTTVREIRRRRSLGPARAALDRRLSLTPTAVRLPCLRLDDRDVLDRLDAWLAAGLRVRIHALGNEAVAQASRLLAQAGAPPGRTSIEHAMLLRAPQREALANSGAVASVQPGFLPHYGPEVIASGVDRHLEVLGLRSLGASGVTRAISSDHPCGPLDPLHNLRRAVDRRLDIGTLQPEQAIAPVEAVEAMTAGGAAALGLPPQEATLVPGAPGDVAVLDGDPFDEQTRVVETWVDGVPVAPRS